MVARRVDARLCWRLPLAGYEGKPLAAEPLCIRKQFAASTALLLRRDRSIADGDRGQADPYDSVIIGTETAISRIARHYWGANKVVVPVRRAAHIGQNVGVTAPGAGLQILIDQAR